MVRARGIVGMAGVKDWVMFNDVCVCVCVCLCVRAFLLFFSKLIYSSVFVRTFIKQTPSSALHCNTVLESCEVQAEEVLTLHTKYLFWSSLCSMHKNTRLFFLVSWLFMGEFHSDDSAGYLKRPRATMVINFKH